MYTNWNTLRHIGLQFFAEDGNNGGADPAGSPADPNAKTDPNPAGGTAGGQDPNKDPVKTDPSGKTYTQEQIKSMMANEKRTARQALLKELGFDIKDDKSFTDTMANIKKTLDAGKTQQQLDAEARKAAEDALKTAEGKAQQLEMKVAALAAGVKADCLDDVITLAANKVTETETIDKVLQSIKTKYPTFFGESNPDGTGSGANPAKKGNNKGEGMGARLAKAHKSNPGKSSYFKN